MKMLKYIILALMLMFVLVFLTTIPGRIKEQKRQEAETTTAATETADTGEDIVTEPPIETVEPEYTGILYASAPEDKDADNEWALFLVNNDHVLEGDHEVDLTTVYTGADGREFQVDTRMAFYFLDMMEAASKAGNPIGVTSAYRSIEYQKNNFDNNVKALMNSEGLTYEEAYAETAKVIALPGASEHNTGLALDILSGEHWALDEGFEETKAFRWLSEHAHEYGFILRYPKDKTEITGISYEPWHYRFVGVYHAAEIKKSGLSLEEYVNTLSQSKEPLE